jgi:shikimate dehydrogenase
VAVVPANFKAELVSCFGQPVAENPTGAMQEAAFQALGLNWRYLTVEVPPAKLRDAMLGVRAFGMQGINLTIPHKVAVIPAPRRDRAGCRHHRRGEYRQA